jgi:hypothetical protein
MARTVLPVLRAISPTLSRDRPSIWVSAGTIKPLRLRKSDRRLLLSSQAEKPLKIDAQHLIGARRCQVQIGNRLKASQGLGRCGSRAGFHPHAGTGRRTAAHVEIDPFSARIADGIHPAAVNHTHGHKYQGTARTCDRIARSKGGDCAKQDQGGDSNPCFAGVVHNPRQSRICAVDYVSLNKMKLLRFFKHAGYLQSVIRRSHQEIIVS